MVPYKNYIKSFNAKTIRDVEAAKAVKYGGVQLSPNATAAGLPSLGDLSQNPNFSELKLPPRPTLEQLLGPGRVWDEERGVVINRARQLQELRDAMRASMIPTFDEQVRARQELEQHLINTEKDTQTAAINAVSALAPVPPIGRGPLLPNAASARQYGRENYATTPVPTQLINVNPPKPKFPDKSPLQYLLNPTDNNYANYGIAGGIGALALGALGSLLSERKNRMRNTLLYALLGGGLGLGAKYLADRYGVGGVNSADSSVKA